mmetsp:Transcript_95404/g.307508  ORF Transcript_95404/g.307508 Transcript_95404/m.307508 type:complete len:332 (+) Transcript_95404:87-1082(+)
MAACDPGQRCCREGFLAFHRMSSAPHWHERIPLKYSRQLEKRCCARAFDILHVGLGKGRVPVVSVDNLLCGLPALLQRHILGGAKGRGSRLKFQPSGLAFPGLDASVPSVLRREVERCLAPIMSAALSVDIFQLPSNSAAAFLRLLTKPPEEWTATQLFPHIDYGASVAATVGLGEFEGTSVGFYAGRLLGSDTPVLRDMRDIAVYKLLAIPQFDEHRRSEANAQNILALPAGGCATDPSAVASRHFELLLLREVRANRALAYPAWLLHKAVVPPEAGARLNDDPQSGRLSLNLFYASEDHPVRRGEAPNEEPPNQDLLQHLPEHLLGGLA